jgi:predicted HTH transcriptional regulator
MDRAGCYPPRFEVVGGFVFQVTLRNEPVYDRATMEWLAKFKGVELSGDQKRMLAYAHAHGDRFTSRECQSVIKTDIYGASTAIKDMIRKGAARSTGKGSRVYLVQEPLRAHPNMPNELLRLLPVLQRRGALKNADVVNTLHVSRPTATRLLNDWVAAHWLYKEGSKRWTSYRPGDRLMHQSQYASGESEGDA